MILSAQSIRNRCGNMLGYGPTAVPNTPMITPFNERTTFEGLSYGLSAAGYDVRIDQTVSIHPGDAILASTIEQFHMPLNLIAQVADKSTWARRFLTVQNTIVEPGWRGFLTLELINHSPLIIDIKRGTPIAQMIFMQLDQPTEQPYSGKYQDQQRGPQKPRREIPDDEPLLPTIYDEYYGEYGLMDENDIIADEFINSHHIPDHLANQAIRHSIRQENDEYVCTCGKRWGTDEGRDHP